MTLVATDIRMSAVWKEYKCGGCGKDEAYFNEVHKDGAMLIRCKWCKYIYNGQYLKTVKLNNLFIELKRLDMEYNKQSMFVEYYYRNLYK